MTGEKSNLRKTTGGPEKTPISSSHLYLLPPAFMVNCQVQLKMAIKIIKYIKVVFHESTVFGGMLN